MAYVMLDLKRLRPDVRPTSAGLEEWIIRTLAHFNVRRQTASGPTSAYRVERPDKGAGREDRSPRSASVCVVGLLRRHRDQCGAGPLSLLGHRALRVADARYGVTSLVDLGHPVGLADVDVALKQAFEEVSVPSTRAADATAGSPLTPPRAAAVLQLAGDIALFLGEAAEA